MKVTTASLSVVIIVEDGGDKDKGEVLNILLPTLITVGIISAIGISGIALYLKKKQKRV